MEHRELHCTLDASGVRAAGAAWRGEREEEVRHAGDLGCEENGTGGEGGNGPAGGGVDEGEGLDDVDVELVAGVSYIVAPPGNGRALGGIAAGRFETCC